MRQAADGELNRLGLDGRQQVVKPLDFSFVVAEEVDAPARFAPLAQLRKEALAFVLIDDQITRFKFSQAVLKKRGGKILRSSTGGAFDNADSGPCDLRSDGDDPIALGDVVQQRAKWQCFLRGACRADIVEEQRAVIKMLNGSLGIEIELPNRRDFVAKKFEPNGQGVLKRKNVQDAAAHGKLAACSDLGDVLVARGGEASDEFGWVGFLAAREAEFHTLERGGARHLAAQRRFREHKRRVFLASARGELLEDPEALGGALGIGQCALDERRFRLRVKESGRHPVEQFSVQRLLGADVRANDPEPAGRCSILRLSSILPISGEERANQRLRCLGDMLKDDWPRPCMERIEQGRDWFSRGDPFEQRNGRRLHGRRCLGLDRRRRLVPQTVCLVIAVTFGLPS